MLLILFLVLAFLIGSTPFSYILGKRLKGIDLRQHGSGNLGATNVFRTLGPWWGALCLFLDLAKGAVAVLMMTWLVSTWPSTEPTPFHIPADLFRIFAGFLAALGHTFSPFVNFQGGKGVATTAGAFAVLAPYAVLVGLVSFLAVFLTTRIVSLGSIVAASILPFAVVFFEFRSGDVSETIIVFVALICGWVIFKHRGNIARLKEGTESKVGGGSSTASGKEEQ
ncbi:acyl-phosphate glycerol 3-phosphate acyltransferase [bacterium DOLJORAL78_65_58]|nr:MAG: acyl-phosphate glycerol 3-phosphate acyltransferase [bacterium DOLZORAL124_64_63]PIE76272.1 MAG: acyl-phosphate glycerol 3-phosphate acyltransferase [bacterium DOLJORAL78_65_58]